jgi:periplasmic protein TonB
MIAAATPRQAHRWVLAFSLVVLAHGALVALLLRAAPLVEPVGEPVMLIDLAPAPEPAKQLEPAPPEPPQETALPAPVPPQPAPPEPAPPVPPEEVVAPVEAEPPPSEPPPAEPDLPEPPPVPEVVKPPLVMPRRTPAVPRPKPSPPIAVARPETPRAAAPPATAPPPPAASAAPGAPPASWQMRLLAHLNRYKRYPPDAQMRRRQGMAVVHLRLMPNGSAERVRLQSSSGTDALDQEAVALIARAQPLPVPEGGSSAVDIGVPIQFTIR